MDQFFGLTRDDRSAAYAAAKQHFHLKHQQRTRLDKCASFGLIMLHAKNGDWEHAETLLKEEGIIAE